MHFIQSNFTNENTFQPNYIKEYINQELPCQFKLKSGKVIYGIILKRDDDESRKTEYYFVSVANHLSKQEKLCAIDYCRKYAQRITIEEIIFAEILRLVA